MLIWHVLAISESCLCPSSLVAGTRLGHFFGSQTKQKILLRDGSGLPSGLDLVQSKSPLKIYNWGLLLNSTLFSNVITNMDSKDYWDMVKRLAMSVRIQ